MYDTALRIVDVDISTAIGIRTIRGFLTCVSANYIDFISMSGERSVELADEDLADERALGFRVVTDEDDIMEFVINMNQQEADKKLDKLFDETKRVFDEIIAYVPVDNSILLEMMAERFEEAKRQAVDPNAS
jgi:hypothetical protein